MFAAAAEKLQEAKCRALHQTAMQYDRLPPAMQLMALVDHAIALSDWFDAALALIAAAIEKRGMTIH